MPLSDAVCARLVEQLRTAASGAAAPVLLELKGALVIVRMDYQGYLNTRVLAALDSAVPGGVRHVRLLPVRESGHVLVIPVDRAGDGAVAVTRLGAGTHGMLPLRAALAGFRLEFPRKRSLRLPFALLPGGAASPGAVGVLTVAPQKPARRTRQARMAPRRSARAEGAPG